MKVNDHGDSGSPVEVLRHGQTVHIDEIRPGLAYLLAEVIAKSSVIVRVPVPGREVAGLVKSMTLLTSPRGGRRIG
jgi:hypothetical protein